LGWMKRWLQQQQHFRARATLLTCHHIHIAPLTPAYPNFSR
jgi:hypothetical protein